MMLRNLDVVLIAIVAPIALLVGVPAAGYTIGAATWMLLRGFGVAADRRAQSARDLAQVVALRLGYRFVRVGLLVVAVVVAEKAVGKHDGVVALVVIVSAFTVQLAWSIAAHGHTGPPPPGQHERAGGEAQP